MLTNWKTITNSIKRLRYLDDLVSGEGQGFTKKELLHLTRERDRLEQELGGIKDMGGVPDLLFVIDTNKELIAIAEAKKLNIPVIAVIDSNSNPDGVNYPIPGNDDAGRAITLYCDLIARAAIDGIERAQGVAGIDIGEAEAVSETALDDVAAETPPATNGKAGEHTHAAPSPRLRRRRRRPRPRAARRRRQARRCHGQGRGARCGGGHHARRACRASGREGRP